MQPRTTCWARPTATWEKKKRPKANSSWRKNCKREIRTERCSERCGLIASPRLNLDVDVHQRHSRRRDPRDSRRLPDRSRLYFRQLLLHFARESADRPIIEPLGDGMLLRFLQSLHGALLLQQVAFVLDLGLDRLQFVSDFGRNLQRRGR